MSKHKVALVTGANKGIGKEIVRQLASQGIRVFLGARDKGRGSDAVGELKAKGLSSVELVILDIERPDSVQAAAQTISEKAGSLDILINNAGAVYERVSPSLSDLELLRKTFETNYFGVVRVTQAMLPLLRKSTHRVIVNVSSSVGSTTLHSVAEWPHASFNFLAYNSSKAALNSFTVLLANELRAEGFKINAVDPGYVATDLNQHRGPGTVEQGARISVQCALSQHSTTGCFLRAEGTLPW